MSLLIKLSCPSCGGTLETTISDDIFSCPYCHVEYLLQTDDTADAEDEHSKQIRAISACAKSSGSHLKNTVTSPIPLHGQWNPAKTIEPFYRMAYTTSRSCAAGGTAARPVRGSLYRILRSAWRQNIQKVRAGNLHQELRSEAMRMVYISSIFPKTGTMLCGCAMTHMRPGNPSSVGDIPPISGKESRRIFYLSKNGMTALSFL